MKKYFALIAMAALALAACTRETLNPEEYRTVLSIGSQPTKTTLGAESDGQRQIYWANGDQVCANGVTSDALADLPKNTTKTIFSFGSALEAPYKAVYPASIWKDASTITLPVHASRNVFPLGGKSSSANFNLQTLTSGVRISVKQKASDPDTDKISLIEISTASTRLSGDFTIDWDEAALTPAASPSGDDLKVRIAGNWDISSQQDFFIPLPVGSYSISVKVMDVNGHYMTKSTTGNKAFNKGEVLQLKAFEFDPSATDTGIEIDTAQKLIDFATAFNNGDYDDLSNGLIVTVTDDITFTSVESAAFNAVGGIGLKNGLNGATEDRYFAGLFNGGSHTISGLTATVPLFVATGRYGHVKDLTLDNTCSFTFTHPNTTELDAGAVIGWHKGELKNVEVAANVSVVAGEVSQETCLGGLTGRVIEGVVDGCSYSGAITVPAGFHSSATKIQIGGIVGRISNASGIVMDTDFEGTIDNQGQMIVSDATTTLNNNPYLLIGGIVGLNAGTVDHCSVANHATGVTVTLTDSESVDHDYTGTIVTHSTNAYHYTIGGIAGRNDATLSDCTNNAAVLNVFSAARGASGNMNGRYVEVGGIAGYNGADATVSGGTNNGTLVNRAVPKMQYLGGIVGRNLGTVSSCSNASTAAITVSTSYFAGPDGARMSYYGGVIGCNESSAAVSDVQNAASITVDQTENVAGVQHRIGGIAGQSAVAIDGSIGGGSIFNSGSISMTYGGVKCTVPTDSNPYGYYLGGIVGYATAAVKNVSNTGALTYNCTNAGGAEVEGGARYVYLGGIAGNIFGADQNSRVDIEYCSNSGALTFDPGSVAPNTATCWYNNNFLGGIAGHAKFVNIKGDSTNKTTNSGNITGGAGKVNESAYRDTTFVVGGIVGHIEGRNSTISYCDLTGTARLYNNHWTNRGVTNIPPLCGGIAGRADGTSANHVVISNCSIGSSAVVTGRRGWVGGIVGYGRGVTVSDCTVPISLSEGSSYGIGGIMGMMEYAEITSCAFSGSAIRSSQLQKGGGIAGHMKNGSCPISGCYSHVTDVSKNGTAVANATGAIVGTGNASASISNCHYKSGMTLCGDSKFTDGGGNSDDL